MIKMTQILVSINLCYLILVKSATQLTFYLEFDSRHKMWVKFWSRNEKLINTVCINQLKAFFTTVSSRRACRVYGFIGKNDVSRIYRNTLTLLQEKTYGVSMNWYLEHLYLLPKFLQLQGDLHPGSFVRKPRLKSSHAIYCKKS